jgi:lysozyme family protein
MTSDFNQAFDRTMKNEGGFVLHTVEGDRGGMTYAGIARNSWPKWSGWAAIDAGRTPQVQQVKDFYIAHFWHEAGCASINDQHVANDVFDFAVNAGTGTAKRLVAAVLAGRDINAVPVTEFVLAFALAKIARYRDIVRRDKTQIKFLMGWVNRTLAGVST